jgi:heme-degrading monooxygenase HmoA
MIRVIIERKFKASEVEKAESALIEIRSKALRAHGYVGGETLNSVEDPSIWVTISTWAHEAAWRAWASSAERRENASKIQSLTVSPEKISVFRVVSRGAGQSAHTLDV